MFTSGHTRYLVVLLAVLAGTLTRLPWGWFEGR
jgi:hypothetical protein